jgi:hypothetical protein
LIEVNVPVHFACPAADLDIVLEDFPGLFARQTNLLAAIFELRLLKDEFTGVLWVMNRRHLSDHRQFRASWKDGATG